MIRTQQIIDTEIADLDKKIADIEEVIKYEQDCFDELPFNRRNSESCRDRFSDKVHDLEGRLTGLQLKREALEMEIPVEDESVSLPKTAALKVAAFSLSLMAFLGLMFVGAMVGLCFLLDNSELSWR